MSEVEVTSSPPPTKVEEVISAGPPNPPAPVEPPAPAVVKPDLKPVRSLPPQVAAYLSKTSHTIERLDRFVASAASSRVPASRRYILTNAATD